jgi:predicted  nucleic acid-binding Zn-ribbon protein
LDKLVSDVAKLHGAGDKIVQNLVTQLRNLIAQWDWAQARHRHVAKIVITHKLLIYFYIFKYFERQQDELNESWEKLHAEMAKFNQQKSDEWAKIASIRSSLQIDKVKASAKKDSDKINDLEAQVLSFDFIFKIF